MTDKLTRNETQDVPAFRWRPLLWIGLSCAIALWHPLQNRALAAEQSEAELTKTESTGRRHTPREAVHRKEVNARKVGLDSLMKSIAEGEQTANHPSGTDSPTAQTLQLSDLRQTSRETLTAAGPASEEWLLPLAASQTEAGQMEAGHTEAGTDRLAQVTSVSELSDVQPGDWA